ncbi:MAG: hypothetical protein HYT80_01540 [Euryarchaeota archaeon]|nr:hypothetical protein [Euryarchaeota archaeon]
MEPSPLVKVASSLLVLLLASSGCIALDDASLLSDLPRRPDGPAPFHALRGPDFGDSSMASPLRLVIDTEDEWQDFWRDFMKGSGEDPDPPGVHFGERFVVVASRGRQGSSGPGILIASIAWDGDYTVRVDHTDVRGCAAAAVMTHPLVAVEVDRMGPGAPSVTFAQNATKIRDC